MRERYAIYLALATGGLVLVITMLFALLQSPEVLSTAVREGRAIPHPVADHQQCDSCHGRAGIQPYPIRHLGWSNASCTKCHLAPDITGLLPTAP